MRFKLDEKTEVRAYYMDKYATDELGTEIRMGVTFKDVFNTLDNRACVYDLLNVHDSLVRERVFEALSKIMKCEYDYIFSQWLKRT
jgi:hypothetical protein